MSRRKKKRVVFVGAAVAAVIVVGGGGAVAASSLTKSPPPVSDKVAEYYKANSNPARAAQKKPPLTLAEVLPKLHGQDEFVLTVLGDSTGFGPQAWVHQTVQQVVERTGRPASIRDWNPATMGYDPAKHLGPEGKETLIVWNGSASGQNASYASANLPAMLPQKSDLVIINHGHNSPALTNATEHLKRLITGVWGTVSEHAAIVVTAQNPRLDAGAASDAEVVQMTKTMPTIYPTISVIDIYAAFTAAGDLAPLLSPDGLHPTPAGHAVWTDAAVKFLGF